MFVRTGSGSDLIIFQLSFGIFHLAISDDLIRVIRVTSWIVCLPVR